MTDPLPPLSDEDLSAVLDGEAGPDVAARAQADPAARARLDELRAAADALAREPVTPLDAATVDLLIARALDAAGEEAPGPVGETDTAGATITPLAPGGRGAGRRTPAWLVAAAVVLLVAVGLALVWSGRDHGDETQTVAQADKTAQTEGADSAGGSATPDAPASEGTELDGSSASPSTTGAAAPPHDLPTTTTGADADQAATGLVDLGAFPDGPALRTALKTAFPTAASPVAGSAAPTNVQLDRCQQQVQTLLAITAEPVHVGLATVAGRATFVYEFPPGTDDDGDRSPEVVAVGQSDCAPVVGAVFFR